MNELDHVGGAPHAVDNKALGAQLITWLDNAEFENGPGWVCWALTSDGRLHVRESPVAVPGIGPRRPNDEQRELARRLVMRANHEANLGGAWVVAWYSDRVFALIWKDRDGDIHANYECDDAWSRIREMTDEEHLEGAAESWMRTAEMQRAMDVKPSERYRYALGEKAPSGKDTLIPSRHRG